MFEKINKEKKMLSAIRNFKLSYYEHFNKGFIFELPESLQDKLMNTLTDLYRELK